MTTQTQDVTEANQDAVAADQAVQAAESQLSDGRRGVTSAALHKLRDTARHARLTADGLRARAQRDQEAARLAGLEQVGAEVDSLAASGLQELPGALRDVAAAVAAVRVMAQGWDVSVAELLAAATDLDVQPSAPAGPRKSSAFLAVKGDTIQHKLTEVRPIGSRLSRVLEHAMAGDINEALAAAGIVAELPSPRRLDHYVFGPAGQVLSFSDPMPPGVEFQVRNGELRPLTEPQIRAYLAGELG